MAGASLKNPCSAFAGTPSFAATALFLFFLAVALFPLSPLHAAEGGHDGQGGQGGQVEEGVTETISIEEAYNLAIVNHEAVRIAAEGVEQARSDVGKATSVMLPQVKAEGTYTKFSEEKNISGFLLQPDNSTSVNLTVSQTLFSGGVEWNSRKAAKLFLQRSREGLDAAREDIVLDTARAYFSVLRAARDLEIKEAALKRAEERRRVAEGRYQVGDAVKSALLRAEAEVAEAQAELIGAGNNLKDAKNVLKRFTGITGDYDVSDPEIEAPLPEDLDSLIQRAYDERLDYSQGLIDREMADLGVSVARGEFLPKLKVEGNYTRRDQDPATTFLLKESASASLVLSYPLFEGGLRKHELYDARSRLREAELRLTGLKKDIEVEVREAYNNVVDAQALIAALKKRLSFAEEDYRMVFEQFKFGLVTTVDVIDSDTELVSAERTLANAAYDLELAALELEYAVGVLLEEELK